MITRKGIRRRLYISKLRDIVLLKRHLREAYREQVLFELAHDHMMDVFLAEQKGKKNAAN